MRKNFGAKPWTYPQPVLILATYGEDGTPDAMNAAWGGISEASEISVCISEGHKTTANILARKAFGHRGAAGGLRLCGNRLGQHGAQEAGESGLAHHPL